MSRVALVPCAALAALVTLAAGCDDPQLACVEDVDFATCQPLYAPTWHNVYTNTIADSCASSSACHGGAGGRSGLSLDGEDAAYAALVNGGYVRPGDPACSELVERLYTPYASLLMPRGARLSDPEACAIGRWVLSGAPDTIDAGVAPAEGASP